MLADGLPSHDGPPTIVRTASGRSRRATVRQLTDEVRDRLAREFIFNGAVPPGELLPSEATLAEHYGVSRVTLRTALRALQDAGILRIRNGVGSVVLQRTPTVPEGLHHLCSLETYARGSNHVVGTVELEWSEQTADEAAAAKLGVAPGSPIVAAHRVKLLDEARVGWGVERVPADLLPLETLQAEYVGSLMDILLAHHELDLEYADCELASVPMPADVAARLGVEVGTCTQYLEQVMYTSEGVPLQWGKAWLLPEYYRFSVRRRRPIAFPG